MKRPGGVPRQAEGRAGEEVGERRGAGRRPGASHVHQETVILSVGKTCTSKWRAAG